MEDREPPRTQATFRIDLSGKSLLTALAIIAGVWLVWKLFFVLVMIVVALVIAGTLNPLVTRLESWRIPRWVAIIIVFTLLLGIVVLVGLVSIPPLITQLSDIMEKAPETQRRIAGSLESYSLLQPLAHSVRYAKPAGYMAQAANWILAYSSQIAILVGEAVTVIFLALYIVAGREREQAGLFAIVPRRYHLRLARVMLNLETIVGGYVRGQVMTSALTGTFVFVLLTCFGVPNAVAIAVFAAVTDVIPFIGALLVIIPAVGAALAARGVPVALVVLGALIVYQEIESRVLIPRIYGRVLRLSPVAVIVALLAGATLLGIVGALLALPVAAAIRMMIKELRVGMPGDDIDRSRVIARDEAAERVFHRRAAGANAGEAAEIATEMAETIRAAPESTSPLPPPRPTEPDPRGP